MFEHLEKKQNMMSAGPKGVNDIPLGLSLDKGNSIMRVNSQIYNQNFDQVSR